ncbi:hypothetical protein LDO51_06400 [Providencia alcalifaciens]|uniref:hypothetical protein n=1 Tax=Providencia alcalifaciens TaxID=126385 RepID=UPI001CE0DB32|nr:hypothetical protein [Providencia alcalifaciens]UBX50412.1 hypothetical protein LDO51_06400 [Providencia alcalifaciens]
MKNKNSQIFEQIISVNKQQENEFNNGQEGAIILSLAVIFLTSFLILNLVRNILEVDYSFGIGMATFIISSLTTMALYNGLKISKMFSEKSETLSKLIAEYKPKSSEEFEKLQSDVQSNPLNLYQLVSDWSYKEKQYY